MKNTLLLTSLLSATTAFAEPRLMCFPMFEHKGRENNYRNFTARPEELEAPLKVAGFSVPLKTFHPLTAPAVVRDYESTDFDGKVNVSVSRRPNPRGGLSVVLSHRMKGRFGGDERTVAQVRSTTPMPLNDQITFELSSGKGDLVTFYFNCRIENVRAPLKQTPAPTSKRRSK